MQALVTILQRHVVDSSEATVLTPLISALQQVRRFMMVHTIISPYG